MIKTKSKKLPLAKLTVSERRATTPPHLRAPKSFLRLHLRLPARSDLDPPGDLGLDLLGGEAGQSTSSLATQGFFQRNV